MWPEANRIFRFPHSLAHAARSAALFLASRKWLLLFLAAALTAQIAAFRPQLKRLAGPSGQREERLAVRAADGEAALLRTVEVSGRLLFAEGMARLEPGAQARMVFRRTRPADSKVSLGLRMFAGSGLSNRLEIQPEGGSPVSLDDQNHLGSPPIDLTPYLGRAQRYAVILSGALAPQAPEARSFFQDMQLTTATPALLPPLAALWGCVLAALAAYWIARRMEWSDAPAAAAAAAVFAACLVSTALAGGSPWPAAAGLAAAVLAAALLLRGRWSPEAAPGARRLALGAILMAALITRSAAFDRAQGTSLEPDAVGYYNLATGMKSPYDSGWREPGFLWALRGFLALTHASHYHYRLMTFSLSVAVAALTYWIGLRWFGPETGLLAALAIACSGGLAEASGRALRGELDTLTVGVFLILAWARGRDPGWGRAVAIGAAAAFMDLTMLTSLSFTAAAIALLAVARRWNGLKVALIAVIVAAAVAPHLRHNRQLYGDPWESLNRHARFYRNIEFAGQPGSLSLEELRKGSYGGPRITVFDYVFRRHSLPEIVFSVLNGWRLMFLGPLARRVVFSPGADFLFFLLGLAVALRLPAGRWTLVFLLLMTGSTAFLAGRERFGDLWRLVSQAAPWMACLAAVGVLQTARWCAALDRPPAPGASRPAQPLPAKPPAAPSHAKGRRRRRGASPQP